MTADSGAMPTQLCPKKYAIWQMLTNDRASSAGLVQQAGPFARLVAKGYEVMAYRLSVHDPGDLYTALVPSNQALTAFLGDPANANDAAGPGVLLNRHVLKGAFQLVDVPLDTDTTGQMFAGFDPALGDGTRMTRKPKSKLEKATLKRTRLEINGVSVLVLATHVASNGIIHVIDAVILPLAGSGGQVAHPPQFGDPVQPDQPVADWDEGAGYPRVPGEPTYVSIPNQPGYTGTYNPTPDNPAQQPSPSPTPDPIPTPPPPLPQKSTGQIALAEAIHRQLNHSI